MQFDNDSGIIVNHLLPFFNKCPPKHNTKMSMNKLYTDFINGEKYYRTHLEPLRETVVTNIIYPSMFGDNFLPNFIRNFILQKGSYQLEYKFKINDVTIVIRITLFNNNELKSLKKYENMVLFMCIWLHTCIQTTNFVSFHEVVIYLYPTKFKKKLPLNKTSNISVNNVNSAFTTRCPSSRGEIIIYRLEEWKKVFIHETFHLFCFDMDQQVENNIHIGITDLFTITTKLSVAEAYSEIWARIINAGYASYISTKKSNNSFDEFSIYFDFSLQIERLFSLLQANKVLDFLDQDWKSIVSRNNNLYKEDTITNVFGYYILCGFLMNEYTEFILWCNEYNSNLYKFKDSNIDAFIEALLKFCGKEQQELLCEFDYGERTKFMKTTTRMSAIETTY